MPSGPKKRRAARRKRPGDADYDGEENEGIESAAAVHDAYSLVANKTTSPTAAAVALAEPVDDAHELSSNGVVRVDNEGRKDVNEGKKLVHGVVGLSVGEVDKVKVKDDIKSSSIKAGDGLGFIAAIALEESAQPVNKNNPAEEDSDVVPCIGKDKGEELHPILESGPNNGASHKAEENDHSESAFIKEETDLVLKAAADIEFAGKPEDVLSSKELTVVDSAHSDDVLQLDSKENVGKEFVDNLVDSSLQENTDKESREGVLDSGHNEADSHLIKGNDLIASASIKAGDNLVHEATDVVQVAEPINALSAKRVVVDHLSSEDALELSSRENAGKFIDDIVDTSLGEEKRSEEPQEAALDSLPNSKTDSQLTAVAVELAEPNVDALSDVVFDKDGPAEVFVLGTKENEGNDFPEDDVDSTLGEERARELPEDVLNSDPNNETYSHLMKDHIKSSSIKVDDGLGFIAAIALQESAQPVNNNKNNPSEGNNNLDLGIKGSAVDSCIGKDKEKELHPILESGPNNEASHKVEENDHTESALIKEETDLVLKAAPDIVFAGKPKDVFSSKELTIVDNAQSDDVLQLDSKENVGKELVANFVDYSLQENTDKESLEAVLDSGHNEAASHFIEGNGRVEFASIKADDCLVPKAAVAIELVEPIDGLAVGVVVDSLHSQEILELCSKENEGKELLEDDAYSSLTEDRGKESPGQVPESDPNSETHFQKLKGTDLIESASIKADDNLVHEATDVVQVAERINALSAKRVDVDHLGSEHTLELSSRENAGKFIDDIVDSSLGEEKSSEEPQEAALDSHPNSKADSQLSVVVDKDGPVEVFGLETKENEGNDFPEDDVDSSLGEERARELPENVLNSDPNNETYSHLSSTAVELAAHVGGLYSKGVVVNDARYEDVVAFGSKENQVEFLEDAAESSIVKDKDNEPPDEILELGPNDENYPHLMEGNDCIESAPAKDDDLDLKAIAAFDLTDLDDALSSKGVVDNIGSKDFHKLGSEENEGNKFLEDVADLSLGEDKFKEHPEEEEFFDWSLNNEMDPHLSTFVEGNDSNEPAMIKADAELALKAIGADDLTDLVDAFSSKDDDADNIDSKDVLEFSSKDNGGNKFLEDVADLILGEEKCKEHPEELLDSCLNNKIDRNLKKNDFIEPPAIINADISSDLKDVAVGLVEPICALSSEVLFVKDNVRSKDVLDLATNNETDPCLTEGNDHILLTKDGDGLVYKEDVELAEPVDAISSKGVVVDIVGYRDILELDPVENDQGEEFLEDAIDSSLWKVKAKELREDVLDSVEGEEHMDDDLVVKDAALNLVGPVDDLSPKGIVGDIVGSEDALELGSKKNEGEFLNDVADSSLGEDKGKELPEEMLDSGPNNEEYPHLRVGGDSLGSDYEGALELGSNKNEEEFLKDVTDSSLEEDKGKEPYEEILDSGPNNDAYPHLKVLSLEIDEDLVCENYTATTLVEPTDTHSPEWVLVNHDDTLDLDTKDCDEKEFIDDTVGSSLEEDESKEPPKKVHGTVLTENDDKPVLLEDPLNNELELGSNSKENDRIELAPADVETTLASHSIVVEANLKESGSKLPKLVVQDALIEDIYVRKHYQIHGEDILELLEAVRKTVEEQIVVVDDMRMNLREMMAKLNSIRTKLRT